MPTTMIQHFELRSCVAYIVLIALTSWPQYKWIFQERGTRNSFCVLEPHRFHVPAIRDLQTISIGPWLVEHKALLGCMSTSEAGIASGRSYLFTYSPESDRLSKLCELP